MGNSEKNDKSPSEKNPSEKNICLIVPALDEAENLAWLLPQLVRYRVIVVDNGSGDGTGAVAEQLGAEVISCSPRGYGRAVIAGLNHLRFDPHKPDIIVVFDADGSSPVACIPQVVEPILERRADFVLGQRTQRERGSMPVHAVFGNWLAVTLISLAIRRRYLDLGPLRALRYDVMEQLELVDQTWGINVEMQLKAGWLGLNIEEVEVSYRARRHGVSKISGSIIGSLRAGSRILISVIYYYWWARKRWP